MEKATSILRTVCAAVFAIFVAAWIPGCKTGGVEAPTAPVQGKVDTAQPPVVVSESRTDAASTPAPVDPQASQTSEERFGVHIERITVTAHGQMLDLRYRVLDPGKAAVLLRRDTKAFLIDEATGKQVPIAVGWKVGDLRQYSKEPRAGRVYFIIFANPERTIKAGAKVTVKIGEFEAQHLTVE